MYNYESNMIEAADGIGNIFRFRLRGHCVIVDGESGTGKTLFVNVVKRKLLDNTNKKDAEKIKNVLIIGNDNKNELGHMKMKHGLVIIDRADFILDKSIVDDITLDFDNRYLIFSRTGLGIPVSPNYYAEIKHKNNEFYLEYAFSEEGWY